MEHRRRFSALARVGTLVTSLLFEMGPKRGSLVVPRRRVAAPFAHRRHHRARARASIERKTYRSRGARRSCRGRVWSARRRVRGTSPTQIIAAGCASRRPTRAWCSRSRGTRHLHLFERRDRRGSGQRTYLWSASRAPGPVAPDDRIAGLRSGYARLLQKKTYRSPSVLRSRRVRAARRRVRGPSRRGASTTPSEGVPRTVQAHTRRPNVTSRRQACRMRYRTRLK